MASATSEPVGTDSEFDRIAALEARLEREKRRREAAEEWAEFLERELEARDETLEAVIEQYERQLEEAKRRESEETPGLWRRLVGRLRS